MPVARHRISFGPFILDPDERQLFRAGAPVALTPRSFEVLALLAARPGRLVTKDELLEAAWPGVVVEENALSVAVSRLRSALGEEGRALVETVPGRGYRFAATVHELHTEAGDSVPGATGGDRLTAPPRWDELVPSLALSGDGAGRDVPGSGSQTSGRGWTRRVGIVAGVGALAALAALVLAAREQPSQPMADRTLAGQSPPSDALLAYRRGRAVWESRNPDLGAALYEFKLAANLDPTFARAHLGQAQVYALWYRSREEAETALARALALDSTLAEAWATRGFILAFQAWDWAGAEAAFARAHALDPDDATTLQWIASMRMAQRRLPEAEAALRRAIALRPDYASLHADLCEALRYRRAYSDALASCDRALALDSTHSFARSHRFWMLMEMTASQPDAVPLFRSEFRRFYRLHEGLRRDTALIAHGDINHVLRRLLAEFLADPPGNHIAAAWLYARLGDRDAALAHVEQAVAKRLFVAPFLNPNPLFEQYRDDPRWVAAVRRMGLEPAGSADPSLTADVVPRVARY